MSWFFRLLPLLACGALVVVMYYPVFFKGYWAVNGSDAVHVHLPNNHTVAEAFRHGRFPLWNPHFNLGQPTIDGSMPIFHPALIFYLLFSPWLANTVEVLLGLLLTCLGIWFFLRQQNLGIFPAAVGMAIYVLSGPVFFLHSYHMGFMAILVLPWCLWVFHQHDRTGHFKWLWVASVLCILAVQSLDSDTLFYLYIGFVIDRLVYLPVRQRRVYVTRWVIILLLTALTGLLLYLPLYEWLIHSSRAARSYTGVLPPNFSNMLTAMVTNQWLTNWPYDVFYFYFGPAVIWLVLAGLVKLNKATYISRYFRYSLIIPIFYITLCFVQLRYPEILSSLDLWRGMFVFCLGLAMVAGIGVRNILQGKFFQQWVTLVIALIILTLAVWAIGRGMYIRTYTILLITSGSILITGFPWSKKSTIFRIIGISLAIVATLIVSAINYAVGTYFCVRYNTEITKNLPFYRLLGKTHDGREGHWRVSVFGGTYNITALAGLKTLPNYTFIYNKKMEDSLCSDSLLVPTNVHPYWMNLKFSHAEAMGTYGARFLVMNGDLCVQASWDDVHSQWNEEGWVERKDFVWSGHRVWENTYYIGRAYIVSSSGKRRSGVQFLQDTPTAVILRTEAEDGDRLVLADLNYPGWQAFVDGKPVPTEVYHGCLRSVGLSKGMHIVRWEYNGRTQRFGLILSTIALLCLVGFLYFLSISKIKEPRHVHIKWNARD